MTPSTPTYVELCARSTYSFLQGASPPEELVAHAAHLGYDVVALTDRDGLYGAVRALEEADKRGVRLLVGCELTCSAGEGPPWATLTVLVENHVGYTNVCRVLTESHARHPKGKPRKDAEGLPRNCFAGIPVARICAHAEGLWAIAHPPYADGLVLPLARAFGARLSIGLTRHGDGRERQDEAQARAASASHGVPLVATNRVLYAHREGKPVLDVLHCIREGLTLDEAGRALGPNAEARLKDGGTMERLFADVPEAVRRSRVIADACRFSLREIAYTFPSDFAELTGEATPRLGETPDDVLQRLTWVGARRRYGEAVPEGIRAQVERELAIIRELEVAPYFLSVEAIVQIARRRQILCQGRGSAANSAVCFCLGITAVDPAESSLLFERFISPERREPPDIDVDFEHERREEVIQEIYARCGRDRAAMVSEVISYRSKSALRDVGKVFGFTEEEVERMSSLVEWWDKLADIDGPRLRDAGFEPADGRVVQVLACARAILGFPRHLSIHVGGFVLSARPLCEVAPVEPATMPGRTVIPWDKDDLDTLRFFKVDVLGLGMLTAIRKALALSRDPRFAGRSPNDQLAAIPREDPVVYDALCRADTVGVFQVESRAQMAMLPRLRPRAFYDLVVEVALVRPGPIQGGMVHPYLRRRSGEERIDCPHPCLEPILKRTLGVPLFQEQVMQIAITGAGYSGGEADQLRRDMAAWRKTGNLERHRERLARGFAERGITPAFGQRLYQQIQGFGEYGFPESHAASFAQLVYASSWLKVHEPAPFAAALVNSQPMGFYSPSTLLQDAARHGVEVRPICIEASDWDCTLEDGAVRVGLRQVKGLGEASGRRIEAARRGGRFASVEDLAARAALARDELHALAEAGALDPLVATASRRAALWQVHAPRPEGLFAGLLPPGELPVLPPMPRAQQLLLDYDRTGLSVADHPMRLMRARHRTLEGVLGSAELARAPHGERVHVAGVVICRQRPQTASGVVFVTLEDEHGFLNAVLYARVFEEYRRVATTSTMLLVEGEVQRSGDVVYVVAERLRRLVLRDAEISSMSRDFH